MTSDILDGDAIAEYPATIKVARFKSKTKVIIAVSSIVSGIIIVGLFTWIYISSNNQFDSVNENIDKDVFSLSEDIKDSELNIQDSISKLKNKLMEIIGEFDTDPNTGSNNSVGNVILKLKNIHDSTNGLYSHTETTINKIIRSENDDDVTLTTIDDKLGDIESYLNDDITDKLDGIVNSSEISLTSLDKSLDAILNTIGTDKTIPRLIKDEIIGNREVSLTSLDTKLNNDVIVGISNLDTKVDTIETNIIGNISGLDSKLTGLIGVPSGGGNPATGIHANIETTAEKLDKSIDVKLSSQLDDITDAMGIVSGTRLYDRLETLINEKTDTTDLKAMLGTNDSSGLRGDIKDATDMIIEGYGGSTSLTTLNNDIITLGNVVNGGINDIKTNLTNELKTNIIGTGGSITLNSLNNDLSNLDGKVIQGILDLTELIGESSHPSISTIHGNIEYTAKQLDDKLSTQLTSINNMIDISGSNNLYTKLKILIEEEPDTTDLQTFITTELETKIIGDGATITLAKLDTKLDNVVIKNIIDGIRGSSTDITLTSLDEKLDDVVIKNIIDGIRGNDDITLTSLDEKLDDGVIKGITDLGTKIIGGTTTTTLTSLNESISDLGTKIIGTTTGITLTKLDESITGLGNTIIGDETGITLTSLNKNIIGDDTSISLTSLNKFINDKVIGDNKSISLTTLHSDIRGKDWDVTLTSLNKQLTSIENTIGSLLNENTNIAKTYTNAINLMTSITDGSIDTSLSPKVVSVSKEITDITVKYNLLCINDRCIIMKDERNVLIKDNDDPKEITCDGSNNCTVEGKSCRSDTGVIICTDVIIQSNDIGLEDNVIIQYLTNMYIATYDKINKIIRLPGGVTIDGSIDYFTYMLPLAAVEKKVYDDVLDTLTPQ